MFSLNIQADKYLVINIAKKWAPISQYPFHFLDPRPKMIKFDLNEGIMS